MHEICSAKDYRPTGERGDAGWVVRFAEAGGDVIISGDVMMRSNVHERLALSETGLITYFWNKNWNRKSFFFKSAMLFNWWPRIDKHMQASQRGKCWEIPMQWVDKAFDDVTPRPDLDIQPPR